MEEISYLTLNEEIYIIILVNTIKAFDKTKHSFLILKKNTLSKLERTK